MSRPIFDLKSFADWIGKQPANNIYDYSCPSKCLIAQYLTARGMRYLAVAPYHVMIDPGNHVSLPETWRYVARPGGTRMGTFGDAHRRAREILAQEAR